MQPLILVLHVLVAVFLVTLVLIQHGKGADIGAAFGSGASNTMFGSVGATSFLMKITVLLSAIFFATSIGLSYLAAKAERQQMVIPNVPVPAQKTAPSGIPQNTNR